jgi:hypothetical protein
MSTELNDAKRQAVLELLIRFNGYLNKSQSEPEHKLESWADFLAIKRGFTVKQVAFALDQLTRRGSPYMPSALEIAQVLTPVQEKKEDLAPSIVSEMLKLIRSFSQYNEREMLEAASENARLAFLALGPTQDIRMSENIETTKAQLERLVKSVLSAKESGFHNQKLSQIGIDPKNVIRISDKKPMVRLDFSDFTNGDPA